MTAVVAPVGAIAALASDWTIEVQHREPPADDGPQWAGASP
jgi:hypothetical protein